MYAGVVKNGVLVISTTDMVTAGGDFRGAAGVH